jgi:hypothetical protein
VTTSPKAKGQLDARRNGLVGVGDLDVVDAGGDSGGEVLLEASLRASTGLLDGVAELVNVLGDTKVQRIVLPVAVEDVLQVQAGTVERELLERVGVCPARDMLVGLWKESGSGHISSCFVRDLL